MKEIFLDTSTNYIIIAYYLNNKIIDYVIKDHTKMHTEKSVEVFFSFLENNKKKKKNINNIYSTNGPGSFVGVRVSTTIIKVLKIIYPDLLYYTANTLDFQRMFCSDKTSALKATKKLNYVLIKNKQSIENNDNIEYDYNNFSSIKKVVENFSDIKNKFIKNNEFNINYLENK